MNDLKSVRKAAELLIYLASTTEPQSFTGIRTSLGMGKASAHRLLATLEDLSIVRRNAETGKYQLGITALRIGVAAGNQFELRRELRPFLSELTERSGETSNLVVLDGTRPVFIDNVESPKNLRIYSRIGRHTFPYCTSVGKVLLAHQPLEFLELTFLREPFDKRTDTSITSKEDFFKELEHIRHLGYAVDNEEAELGARCVGAPILNDSGRAIAAISISGPSARINHDHISALGRMVMEVAEKAQQSLGVVGNRTLIGHGHG